MKVNRISKIHLKVADVRLRVAFSHLRHRTGVVPLSIGGHTLPLEVVTEVGVTVSLIDGSTTPPSMDHGRVSSGIRSLLILTDRRHPS